MGEEARKGEFSESFSRSASVCVSDEVVFEEGSSSAIDCLSDGSIRRPVKSASFIIYIIRSGSQAEEHQTAAPREVDGSRRGDGCVSSDVVMISAALVPRPPPPSSPSGEIATPSRESSSFSFRSFPCFCLAFRVHRRPQHLLRCRRSRSPLRLGY